MFLKKIIERNGNLIDTVVELHQKGLIPANAYVLDLDTIYENGRLMAEQCHQHGMKLYPMTKQIGRNPAVVRTLNAAGADGYVCVDMADARRVFQAGGKVGHLGHLVQVPAAETEAAVLMKPEYWTVYSFEKAEAISKALPRGWTQKVMLRIYGANDIYYTGHEGGFPVETVVEAAEKIDAMPGLKFAGITTFPTQLFNKETGTVEHTENYRTLIRAKEMLAAAGYTDIELNAPGTTSSHLFEEMAANGVTQVEPGHGLTGTTPVHALRDMAEKPGVVYVSEVCHFYKGRGYCYGGGMYIDPVFDPYTVKACVGSTPEQAKNNLVACDIPNPAAIDYYGIFEPVEEGRIRQGDTVVFGYRIQAFVTRGYVVPISGISKGEPKIEGIYDSDGKLTGWPHC